jgi:DnaK suppressor protein
MPQTIIDEGYRPNDDEPFMNDRQREYFRRKLNAWKTEILREAQETIAALQN